MRKCSGPYPNGIIPIIELDEAEKNCGGKENKPEVAKIDLPVYEAPAYRGDIIAGYQEKIGYEMAKGDIKIGTNAVMNKQRIEYERELQDLQFCYKAYLQMLSPTIYRDVEGNIFLVLDAMDNIRVVAKKLLNVDNFRSRIYESYYPEFEMVLEIAWGKEKTCRIIFEYGEDGILPNAFLKKLKSRGILLLVSGRTEKSAADALLAFSFYEAERVEISPRHGWIKRSDRKWHFAGMDEMTMEELRKNG